MLELANAYMMKNAPKMLKNDSKNCSKMLKNFNYNFSIKLNRNKVFKIFDFGILKDRNFF